MIGFESNGKGFIDEQEALVFFKPRFCRRCSGHFHWSVCRVAPVVRLSNRAMDMSFLVWVLAAFLVGLVMGCVLGNHWAKVAFYWTQNKIRHLRD